MTWEQWVSISAQLSSIAGTGLALWAVVLGIQNRRRQRQFEEAVRQEQVSINNVLITVPRPQGRELRVKVVNTGLRPVFVHTVGMYDSSGDRMMLFAESRSDQPLEPGEPRLYGRNVVEFGKFKDHAPQDVWIAVHSHTKELNRAGGDVFLHHLREGLEWAEKVQG